VVELKPGEASLALHDLTGFDGRCDAILLSNDASFTPPDGAALVEARRKWLNPEGASADAGEFDLVAGDFGALAAALGAWAGPTAGGSAVPTTLSTACGTSGSVNTHMALLNTVRARVVNRPGSPGPEPTNVIRPGLGLRPRPLP
jgi:hypothetical protein